MGVAAAVIVAYVVGAFPMGLVLGKLLKGIDIRQYGSGKTGAANVLRTLGARAAVGILLFDMGKGAGAVFLARSLADGSYPEVLAALAALVGHNWSIFIRFTGGRGINTGLGGLLAMVPTWGAGTLGAGLLVIGLSRYVSLGSLSGVVFCAVSLLALALTGREPWEYFGYAAGGGALIFLQHRDNIVRLLKRQERRLGEKGERRPPLSRAADMQ